MSKLRTGNRVVCSSLELAQTQSLNRLPCCTITLVLSKDGMSEMENSSFSGLDLLERPLWSVLAIEAMLVSMVCCPKVC